MYVNFLQIINQLGRRGVHRLVEQKDHYQDYHGKVLFTCNLQLTHSHLVHPPLILFFSTYRASQPNRYTIY